MARNHTNRRWYFGLLIVAFSSSWISSQALSAPFSEVFEHATYRVVCKSTGRTLEGNQRGRQMKYEEMVYKLSITADNSVDLFKPENLAEIQVLDTDGYILASDLVTQDSLLQNREYYAYLWMSSDSIPQVSDIKFVSLETEQIAPAKLRLSLQQKDIKDAAKQSGFDEKKLNEKVVIAEKVFESPVRAELNRNNNMSIIDQNISKIHTLLKESLKQEKAPVIANDDGSKPKSESLATEATEQPVKPSQSPRITNDDIAAFLKEFDKKSPSQQETNGETTE